MPFWPDNINAVFCYAEAGFYEHGVNDARAQLLAVVKALLRESYRYVTLSVFTSDVSEPYETLKRSILWRIDLIDRQGWANSLIMSTCNTVLQQTCCYEWEVICHTTFDDGLFKELFLSRLLQPVQAVLKSFQNNAVDELDASANRILETTKSNDEVFSKKSLKLRRMRLQSYVIHLHVTVTTVNGHTPTKKHFT